MNVVLLTGNLGRDPEVTTGNGGTRCRLRLAVDRYYMSGGKRKQATDWIDVVVWGKQGETCHKYLRKGRLVQVQGELRTRSYEHNGQKRSVVEVVADKVDFLDKPSTEPEVETDSEAKCEVPYREGGDLPQTTPQGFQEALKALFQAFNPELTSP